MSQRDHRTLGHIRATLDPGFREDPAALDHQETPWFRRHLGRPAP